MGDSLSYLDNLLLWLISAILVINRVWFLHSSLDIFKKRPSYRH